MLFSNIYCFCFYGDFSDSELNFCLFMSSLLIGSILIFCLLMNSVKRLLCCVSHENRIVLGLKLLT